MCGIFGYFDRHHFCGVGRKIGCKPARFSRKGHCFFCYQIKNPDNRKIPVLPAQIVLVFSPGKEVVGES